MERRLKSRLLRHLFPWNPAKSTLPDARVTRAELCAAPGRFTWLIHRSQRSRLSPSPPGAPLRPGGARGSLRGTRQPPACRAPAPSRDASPPGSPGDSEPASPDLPGEGAREGACGGLVPRRRGGEGAAPHRPRARPSRPLTAPRRGGASGARRERSRAPCPPRGAEAAGAASEPWPSRVPGGAAAAPCSSSPASSPPSSASPEPAPLPAPPMPVRRPAGWGQPSRSPGGRRAGAAHRDGRWGDRGGLWGGPGAARVWRGWGQARRRERESPASSAAEALKRLCPAVPFLPPLAEPPPRGRGARLEPAGANFAQPEPVTAAGGDPASL